MQPTQLISKRRPILGIGALIAIAAAAYFILAPSKPLVLTPDVLAGVTPADTFKRVAGDGKRPLHLFISVDCTFCHQIEPEVQKLKNVTVYYHLLPGHSPAARQEAQHVWCALDQAGAWASIAGGGVVTASSCNDTALDRNLALAKGLGIERTPAIVFADGKVMTGAQSSDVLARGLLSSEFSKGR